MKKSSHLKFTKILSNPCKYKIKPFSLKRIDEAFDADYFVDLDKREENLQKEIWKFKKKQKEYEIEKQEINVKKEIITKRYLEIFEYPTFLSQVSDTLSKRFDKAIQILSEPVDLLDEIELYVSAEEAEIAQLEDRLSHKCYDLSELEERVSNEQNELEQIMANNLLKSQGNESLNASVQTLSFLGESFDSEESIDSSESSEELNLPSHQNKVELTSFNFVQIQEKTLQIQNHINQIENEINTLNSSFIDHKKEIETSLNEKLNHSKDLQNQFMEIEKLTRQITELQFYFSATNEFYQHLHLIYEQVMQLRARNDQLIERQKKIDSKTHKLNEQKRRIRDYKRYITKTRKNGIETIRRIKNTVDCVLDIRKLIDQGSSTIINISNDIFDVPISPYPKIYSDIEDLQALLFKFDDFDYSNELEI